MSENILLTVNQFSEKHQAFSKGAIRSLIFRADTNGFNKVIRRIGGRVLLNEQAFFEWVEEINGAKAV
jgi:hypothetical protein